MKNQLQKCRFSNLESITAKVFLMFAVLTCYQQVFAQFIDDFSDGDFVSNPMWIGNDSSFVIDSSRLRLKADASTNVAYLATSSTSINDATWEFLVQLDFNPSTSNFVRIYLVSNIGDLSKPLNGYFVQVGSTADDVSLYKQTGTTIVRIIDGAIGRLNAPTVISRVKVTRDRDGTWEIYSDVGATGNYANEGSTHDNTHNSSEFFGISCHYTSTRTDKFYFDDFSIEGDGISDLTPPELTDISAPSSNQLRLTFTEEIIAETATNVSNYVIDGIGLPQGASLDIGSNNVVILTFATAFIEETQYTITVNGISDKYGNAMFDVQKTVRITASSPVQIKDIIITEIFSDPSPNVGLPEVEFVEIFNRSENSINIDGWTFGDGSSYLKFINTTLEPREFLIVTSDASLFPIDLKSFASTKFPALNNSGDYLILKDAKGKTIDSLQYSIDWYRNDKKREGGWSLELIDPENVCADAENWIASEHPSGGTPGTQNSVMASKPDLSPPFLQSAIPVSTHAIQLNFNERMQTEMPTPDEFVIDPEIRINRVSYTNASLHEIFIELSNELVTGISYSVTVVSISDCSGNKISEGSNKTTFGVPEEPIPSDILVNEVLFNPRPAGVDFVEIVNVSKKYLNIKGWVIGNHENDSVTNTFLISTKDRLLDPGEYLVFTEDLDALKGDYPLAHEQNILEVENTPPLNDDSGSIVISKGNIVLDHFNFDESYHSVFVKNREGVSLERIALNMPTNDAQNWTSSSTVSGFATPGYFNSNSPTDLGASVKPIQIEPEVFVPIDSQPDFVRILYNLDHGGYVANVKVVDSQGHLIKQVANNELLGTEGAFRWDGDRYDGVKVRVGYYLIIVEVFDDIGNVKTFLNRVAVATRF